MRFGRLRRRALGRWKGSARAVDPGTAWLLVTLAALVMARPAHAVVHASILVDAQSGKVLESYHADERAHPASLTKLMTLYITFEHLKDGSLDLGTELNVSRLAAIQQPSRMGLIAGSRVTVEDCILGITSHSANDAAVVLAEGIGGTEARFVELMNREAAQLGMTRTIFYNANGLPDYRQWTTARDMSRLALALIRTYPQYYHFFDTPIFDFHGEILHTYDHMLEEYPGADGMKTGYIYSSGYNIVTSAMRDHRRLVGVVLGGRTALERDRQMIALLNRGFAMPSPETQEVASAAVPAARPAATRPATHRIARVVKTAAYVRPIAAADWTIQIGAGFRTERDVYQVLGIAKRSVPGALGVARPLVVRLRGDRYRARFTNMTHEGALSACAALRDRRFTCTILEQYPTRQQYVASAGAARSGTRE